MLVSRWIQCDPYKMKLLRCMLMLWTHEGVTTTYGIQEYLVPHNVWLNVSDP